VHRVTTAAALASLALTFPGTVPTAAPPERTTVVVEVDSGFHWLDAGVGAAAMLGLIALVYGAVLLRRAAAHPESERSPNA
jgi:hypothetical protein